MGYVALHQELCEHYLWMDATSPCVYIQKQLEWLEIGQQCWRPWERCLGWRSLTWMMYLYVFTIRIVEVCLKISWYYKFADPAEVLQKLCAFQWQVLSLQCSTAWAQHLHLTSFLHSLFSQLAADSHKNIKCSCLSDPTISVYTQWAWCRCMWLKLQRGGFSRALCLHWLCTLISETITSKGFQTAPFLFWVCNGYL